MMFDANYLQRLHLLGLLNERKMKNMEKTNQGKVCPSCNLYKERHEFGKAARASDGLTNLCNTCRNKKYPREGILSKVNSFGGITVEGKICPSCKTYKRSEEYSKSGSSLDGLSVLCKKCKGMGKTVPQSYYNSPEYAQRKAKAEGTSKPVAPNDLEGKLIALNAELNDLSMKLKEYSQENAELRNKLKIIEHKEILSTLEDDKKKRRQLLNELG